MSEADFHNNAPTSETAEVSAETKALVEDNMPQESDEIKHHVMALIEAIKKQSQSQIETAGDMTREVYVNAMRQAQETLKNTGLLLDNQRETLDSSISSLEDTATQKWEAIVSDMQKFGDRLDRAVNTAWQILTEPETKPTANEPTTIDITEDNDDPAA